MWDISFKIDAKIVTHSRDVTFRVIEAAVARDLFRETFRMIVSLCPTSAPG